MLGSARAQAPRPRGRHLRGPVHEVVRDLSNAKQEIINFRAVIRPQRAVFRSLERAKQRYLSEELDIYFDDLTDASERIWDVLENFKEIVEGLESTNESALSHRLNDGLRVLTAGERHPPAPRPHRERVRDERRLSGEGSPLAFWTILFAMIAMVAGMGFPAAGCSPGAGPSERGPRRRWGARRS